MNTSVAVKKKPYYRRILIYFGAAYLAVVSIVALIAYRIIANEIQQELGEKAKLIAVDISGRINIDDREFNRLLALDFNALLKDNVNYHFENRARTIMKYSDIKYIYVQCPVPNNKVKYRVEKDETAVYNKPEGTPLDVVYLLDAVVDEPTRWADTDGKWYRDKHRYTVTDEQYAAVLKSRNPTVIINSDQWGAYITGYAPLFNDRYECIGLVGVDLVMNKYLSLSRRVIAILAGLTFTLLLIGIFALYLIVRVRKAEDLVEEKSTLSDIDGLTLLYNRRRFIEILKSKWEKNKKNKIPLSLLIVDVDYFKDYNDHYGHLSGDEVLRKVACELKHGIRHDYDFAGRYGGDEFIILLNNSEFSTAKMTAENLIMRVKELNLEHKYSKAHTHVTISVGCASVVPYDELTLEDFFHMADNALYLSKEKGRNQLQVWDNAVPDRLHRPLLQNS